MRRTSQILGLVVTTALLAVAGLGGQRGGDVRRDGWQRPDDVLDAVGAQPGARVADVGAGDGYFTFKMAARVGQSGRVYAEDIRDSDLNRVRERKAREKLEQIEVVLGEPDDPRLPEGLDGILVFNAYHEFREYDAMLACLFHALRPGGRLVVVDRAAGAERDRSAYFAMHAITTDLVQAEAERHGFTLRGRPAPLDDPQDRRDMFILVFERPLAPHLTPVDGRLAIPTRGPMGWTGWTGGQIRRSEFSGATVPPAATAPPGTPSSR